MSDRPDDTPDPSSVGIDVGAEAEDLPGVTPPAETGNFLLRYDGETYALSGEDTTRLLAVYDTGSVAGSVLFRFTPAGSSAEVILTAGASVPFALTRVV